MYPSPENIRVFIDIKSIAELHTIKDDESCLSFGGNVSLTELMNTLKEAATKYEYYTYGIEMAKHIDLVATVPVRNVNIKIFLNRNLISTFFFHFKMLFITNLISVYFIPVFRPERSPVI